MQQDSPETATRGLQIIYGAMAFGLVTFMAVALVLVMTNGPLGDEGVPETILVAVVWIMGVFQIPAFLAVRAVIRKQIAAKVKSAASDEEALAGALGEFRGLGIISAAFAEGFGLFGTVVYLLTGNWLALAAGAIGFALLVVLFPTQTRLQNAAAELRRAQY